MRARWLARRLVTLMVVTAGCAAASPGMALGGAHAASSHTVVLRHNQYLPGTVSIRRGDSVVWVWEDGNTLHNVIGRGFQSRTFKHGTFTVRFTRSGTYNYRCTVHPHMTGRVVVH